MKNLITSITLLTLLSACSSLPSYHEMSCSDLQKQEKSLQEDLKFNTVDSILSGVTDIIKDTTESTVDSLVADQQLSETKSELREVQSVISKKHCKK